MNVVDQLRKRVVKIRMEIAAISKRHRDTVPNKAAYQVLKASVPRHQRCQ